MNILWSFDELSLRTAQLVAVLVGVFGGGGWWSRLKHLARCWRFGKGKLKVLPCTRWYWRLPCTVRSPLVNPLARSDKCAEAKWCHIAAERVKQLTGGLGVIGSEMAWWRRGCWGRGVAWHVTWSVTWPLVAPLAWLVPWQVGTCKNKTGEETS